MDDLASAAAGRNRLAALLAAAVMACFSFATGYSALNEVPTGRYSETIVLDEAARMWNGDHRFGIVEYSHYPNGPTYVVALLQPLGLEVHSLRLVPVAVMAASVGGLVFVLWMAATSTLGRGWILLALGELLLQPGVMQWQGALHEHSYVVSFTLVALALSIVLRRGTLWLLVPFGFVLGWTGYDWIPGQTLAVLLGRWLVHTRDPDADLLRAGVRAGLDAMWLASGFALAVLAHLLQLVLYFGSAEDAVRDLIGSAAGRAGSDAASTLNPEYGQRIADGAARMQAWIESRPDFESTYGGDYDASDPPRWRLPGIMLRYFWLPRWTSTGQLAATAGLGIVVLAVGFRGWIREARPERAQVVRRAGVAGIAIGLALAAGMLWSLLMPNHASDHVHIVPRHYFMTLAALCPIPILLLPGPTGPVAGGAGQERLIGLWDALWTLPLLALAGVVAATFLVLG